MSILSRIKVKWSDTSLTVKPIFEKLFGIGEYVNLTKEGKIMYDSSMKYKWDNKNVKDFAFSSEKKKVFQKACKRVSI